MHYRRKIILALLEKFGGELKPIHLQKLKELFEEHERVAITCLEKEHLSCHRHKISDYMEKEFGVPVEHL